jgi:hypothetical protein
MRKISALLFALVICQSTFCFADQVKDFLLSCAYGTLTGAALGVASVAFSENPGEKSMNIARGASLGLYAGIGYGIYQTQHSQLPPQEVQLWFSPHHSENFIGYNDSHPSDGRTMKIRINKF